TVAAKEEKPLFSDEEYAAAAYMTHFSKKDASVDDVFYHLTKESPTLFSYNKDEKNYKLSQKAKDTTLLLKIETDTVSAKSDATSSEYPLEWTKKELDNQYKDYQKLVEKFVTTGKNLPKETKNTEVKTTEKEIIDTKNLTETQVVAWIKNYLTQNGAPSDSLEKKDRFQTSMVEGYLVVSEYLPVPTGAFDKMTYQYRVNSNGHLEKKDVTTANEWEVISEEYIAEANLESKVATKTDISAQMEKGSTDGPAMFYHLIITNTSNEAISVSTDNLSLHKKSGRSSEDTLIPVRYPQTVIIQPNKYHKFHDLLGGVSGDTPMYNNLDVYYNEDVIFHQAAGIADYR
ncbi:MAG: hypothetical protein RR554_07280, partial [Vagococcus sp.]